MAEEARIARVASTGPSRGAGPLIGLCYSGEFRALDYTMATVRRHVVEAFGGKHVGFFYLSLPPGGCNDTACKRSTGPRQKGLGTGSNRALVGHWDWVSDSCALRTLRALRAPSEVFYGTPPRSMSTFCGSRSGLYVREGGSQYAKLQASFTMLRSYETRWHAEFDWVLRLRTDMLFLESLPHHSTLSVGAHLPSGMVMAGYLNDHAMVISRKYAAAYFDLASEWACNTTEDAAGERHTDNSTLIVDRLRSFGVPQQSIMSIWMPYVLLRPSKTAGAVHPECWRLSEPGTVYDADKRRFKITPVPQNAALMASCCAMMPETVLAHCAEKRSGKLGNHTALPLPTSLCVDSDAKLEGHIINWASAARPSSLGV